MGLYILCLIGNVQIVSNFRTILINFGVVLKNVSQGTQLYGNHIILYSTSGTVMHSKISFFEMKHNTLLQLEFKLKLYWALQCHQIIPRSIKNKNKLVEVFSYFYILINLYSYIDI